MKIPENLEKLFSLKGKVVLLTGATGGIGSELARGLAGVGADLALADLAQPALDALAGELGEGDHTGFILDVCNLSSVNQVVQDVLAHYGRIDVLIN